jgi:hypothetical protein
MLRVVGVEARRFSEDIFLVEPMGFEFTSDMKTKEFCGAAWPSKSLKGKEGNS